MAISVNMEIKLLCCFKLKDVASKFCVIGHCLDHHTFIVDQVMKNAIHTMLGQMTLQFIMAFKTHGSKISDRAALDEFHILKHLR